MTTANHAALKATEFDFSAPQLYNPIYVPLFYNRSRFIHLYGSAGSGKSVFAYQKEIVLSFDGARKGKRTLVLRRYENTLAVSAYFELKRIISDWNLENDFTILKSPLSIKNKHTGVEFIFRGLDDVEKLKSISGVDRILVEEATEVQNRSDIDQLNIRLRGVPNGQITLMYNPVNSQHWLNQEIHQQLPPRHFILKTTYRDNLRLQQFENRIRRQELADGVPEHELSPTNAEILESFKESNPNYYKVYGLGEWGSNPEGVIYEFQTVSTMPLLKDGTAKIDAYGLDFGFNDPCALVECAIVDEPNQAQKSLYVRERLYERKLTSVALRQRMDALAISKRIPIYADSARPEMISELQGAGYWVIPCEKGAGSVKKGIDHVKSYQLKLVAGSKNLIIETSNYSWKNKHGVWLDEPQDGLDHCCDAFRYASQVSTPGFSTTTWGTTRS